ncbi:endonuclease/exonuclease/phosphatase family metal-dependent hydrolase [Rhizobium sp. BK316]|uniref:endonuclease/exonuclease/phosphatase family protein n=1 Tax=Rhizobium sp. BK316 TaxID=2587053 RepID=UPI00160E9686|nr:endonuclease/exonuclease/phosphatase family protein [Rhizobium sp. BK316]MBB3410035.1 endonuclease/exonuclease/phosphatase family metal-dependent hydrolase [Rhizobium sp. BK316]
MVAYWKLRYAFRRYPADKQKALRDQTIDGLKRLKTQIAAAMPIRTAGQTLLLGTWNIRNFDDNRFGDGPRLDESFFYLAEVVSAFDIIAVQEICEDMAPFERLMETVGPEYDYIMTDVTLGESGNKERLGFIYNKNKVHFTGVAGELVLPFEQQISDVTKARQFARTPFSCSFQSGWFKFNFATVHIYYGKDKLTAPEFKRRVNEIDAVAKFVADRAKEDKTTAHILVGDFNIDAFDAPTFDALDRHGFQVFKNNIGSNSTQTKFYDQISFMPEAGEVSLANPGSGKAHGVLNVFESVFRKDDLKLHRDAVIASIDSKIAAADEEIARQQRAADKPGATTERIATAQRKITKQRAFIAEQTVLKTDEPKLQAFYEEWRTYQISDHFPLFVELNIDFAAGYLDKLKNDETIIT